MFFIYFDQVVFLAHVWSRADASVRSYASISMRNLLQFTYLQGFQLFHQRDSVQETVKMCSDKSLCSMCGQRLGCHRRVDMVLVEVSDFWTARCWFQALSPTFVAKGFRKLRHSSTMRDTYRYHRREFVMSWSFSSVSTYTRQFLVIWGRLPAGLDW